MPIIRVRRSPATLDELLIRVRRAVGDIVDDAAPAAGDRKWENDPIVDAINDMLAEMYQEFFQNPDQIVIETALTYTGGSEEVEIPGDTATGLSIYGVFDVENGRPRLLRRVDYLSAEKYRTDGSEPSPDTERVWCQRDEFIMIRPIPTSDLTLSVATFGAPFGMDAGDTTDQHPFPVVHEELLVLGAANRLQYPNDQLPIGRQVHYNKLWMKWLQDCDRYQGPRYPVENKRYRT